MKKKEVYSTANSPFSEEDISKHPIPEVNELEINLSRLRSNYNIIRSLLNPGTKFMAVLKGDAYGHGLTTIAKELENCKCDTFGLVRLIEAFTLRNAGITTPILLLAPIDPSQVSWVFRYNITPMVDNIEIAEALASYAFEHNKTINIHIKVNTGLNRYGVESNNVLTFIQKINQDYPHLHIEGIYTHLQDPDFNTEMTIKQIDLFNKILNDLNKENLRPKIVHIANSSGLLGYPQSHHDMVRCGMLLFGLMKKEGGNILPEGVKPLIIFKSLIMKLTTIKKGEVGGYGRNFVASRDTRVAIVGVGFADGVSRNWKEVLIAGQRVPVVNYFMDAIMVDITDLKETVNLFDEVVIIGTQGSKQITWQDACKVLGSKIDEQIQRITERVPKHYFYEKNR
ncbi:MAG: Alanine racemase [Bacillales bacterium]|nr:Alanine racemase [Bacillales bacterium]